MKSCTFDYQSRARMELVNCRAQSMQEECCFDYGIVTFQCHNSKTQNT